MNPGGNRLYNASEGRAITRVSPMRPWYIPYPNSRGIAAGTWQFYALKGILLPGAAEAEGALLLDCPADDDELSVEEGCLIAGDVRLKVNPTAHILRR
jgi:hypothetical protein